MAQLFSDTALTDEIAAVVPVPRYIPDGLPAPMNIRIKTVLAQKADIMHTDDVNVQIAWAIDVLELKRMTHISGSVCTIANNIVSHLAAQQHPDALYYTAKCMNEKPDSDDKAAIDLCFHAINRGNKRALYLLGRIFEAKGEIESAKCYYMQGADSHDAASLYRIAISRFIGDLNSTVDISMGMQYLRRSADSVDRDFSQSALLHGLLLAGWKDQIQLPKVIDSPVDSTLARYYILKAAKLYNAQALFALGTAWQSAELGFNFDPELSLHCYLQASYYGDRRADMELSKWLLAGYGDILPKDEKLAVFFAQRAATAGISTALFAVGYFFEVGVYLQVSKAQATKWYMLAKDAGSTEAAKRLSELSLSRTLTQKDHEKNMETHLRRNSFKRPSQNQAVNIGGQQSEKVVTSRPSNRLEARDQSASLIDNAPNMCKPSIYRRNASRSPSRNSFPASPEITSPISRSRKSFPASPESTSPTLRSMTPMSPSKMQDTILPHEPQHLPMMPVELNASILEQKLRSGSPNSPLSPKNLPRLRLSDKLGESPRLADDSRRTVLVPEPSKELQYQTPNEKMLNSGSVHSSASVTRSDSPIYCTKAWVDIERQVNNMASSTQKHLPSRVSSIGSESKTDARASHARNSTRSSGNVSTVTDTSNGSGHSSTGPQTFQEMGVPIAKNERDCTIM
ncbi:hypothetical protein CANCADRAFT_43116 [Tortispora caseinolytica NRRL Y-17796]|uniref:Uncharacterized protein n=1 Tax=Tortispora caseinolytica NRRL Y-17796 TaxID=767744 RepID=A0A1E4TLA7_9ASCO|nr:hypothetical protein CANCADRAFT_43116 [Tortispora caseinolytica NRRL Y-17796]